MTEEEQGMLEGLNAIIEKINKVRTREALFKNLKDLHTFIGLFCQ